MKPIRLLFAASLAVVLLGNIAPPQSGSVISTQATALPGVHVSPLPSPLATPDPREDSDRQERREARKAKQAAERGLDEGVKRIPDSRP